ncbi:hypothetical protein [Acrocarpospora sp. B8E8]|uniref:hypothetical protein n=1 Tax=Acrocarpospora sp. B8E8 TaxID=3153572 RepID=UPI00325D92CC
MTEQTAETTLLDRVERFTVVTDGGRNGRGRTQVYGLMPEDVEEVLKLVRERAKW